MTKKVFVEFELYEFFFIIGILKSELDRYTERNGPIGTQEALKETLEKLRSVYELID